LIKSGPARSIQMQKNVLHLIASLDPEKGGVSSAVRIIINGLKQNNILSETVCFDDPDSHFIKNIPFRIHALGNGKSPWKYNKKFIPWLLNNVSRFDVVILHGLWLYNGFAINKAFSLLQKKKTFSEKATLAKFYIMPHGMLDPYFQLTSKRRLKAIRNWLYWKFLEKNTVNNADGILFTCEEEKLLARQSFTPYTPKKELVIGLGLEKPPAYISIMRAAFLESCEGLNGPYLLFLGRLHEKKGIDLLLNGYNQIFNAEAINSSSSETGLNISYPKPKLIIAGPQKESMYGMKIQKIINDNPFLKENVILPGMLEGNAKWGAYYGCEAFVLTSHQENFGLVIVEAMACGIPVLISNKVNIWREINESAAGLISDNTQTAVNTLLRQWQGLDNNARNTMREKAIACYENYFSIHKVIDSLINIIH
jgi:glycosyltransferase involved in cell wall biosynthesis